MEVKGTMCKELKTNCICERCGETVQVDPKKIGPIVKKGSYPEDWLNVQGFWLCGSCAEKFGDFFNPFMKKAD